MDPCRSVAIPLSCGPTNADFTAARGVWTGVVVDGVKLEEANSITDVPGVTAFPCTVAPWRPLR